MKILVCHLLTSKALTSPEAQIGMLSWPGFRRMKSLGVFLLPLDRMLGIALFPPLYSLLGLPNGRLYSFLHLRGK